MSFCKEALVWNLALIILYSEPSPRGLKKRKQTTPEQMGSCRDGDISLKIWDTIQGAKITPTSQDLSCHDEGGR